MTVKVTSNSGQGFYGKGNQGIGGRGYPTGMGWVGFVNDKVGDVKVVPLSDIVTGDINQGVFFQASGAVIVEFTMTNPGIACHQDPDVANTALWGNALTLTAKTIVPCLLVFTACRITFTGPGTELYIGVR